MGLRADGVTHLHIGFYRYPYSTSNSKLSVYTLAVRREFTVLQAITALLRKNRDRYRLNRSSSSGCRYWCKVVLNDFVEYGWLEAGAPATVDYVTSVVHTQYPNVSVPMPAPYGQFF